MQEALSGGGNIRKSVLTIQCDKDPKIQKVNFRNSSELAAVFPKPRSDKGTNTGDPCEPMGSLGEMNENVSAFYTLCQTPSPPFLPFG